MRRRTFTTGCCVTIAMFVAGVLGGPAVAAGATVDPPVIGGSPQGSFEIAANPADQTVTSGQAAEFFLATQGANGGPIQIQLAEWSTQADPSTHDPASVMAA